MESQEALANGSPTTDNEAILKEEVKEVKSKLASLLANFKIVQQKSRDRKRQVAELLHVPLQQSMDSSSITSANASSLESSSLEKEHQQEMASLKLQLQKREQTLEDQARQLELLRSQAQAETGTKSDVLSAQENDMNGTFLPLFAIWLS